MRPHPDNTSEATGIKRSNFHFDDQTGSLHAVMQTHTEPMPRSTLMALYASLKPAATNEYAIAVHNHENAFSFNETIFPRWHRTWNTFKHRTWNIFEMHLLEH